MNIPNNLPVLCQESYSNSLTYYIAAVGMLICTMLFLGASIIYLSTGIAQPLLMAIAFGMILPTFKVYEYFNKKALKFYCTAYGLDPDIVY